MCLGVVRKIAATFVAFVGQAKTAADADGAARLSSAKTASAALATAAFETVRALAAAAAIALFDNHTALLTAARGSLRAALGDRVAPIVVIAAELFAVAMPKTARAVTTFRADEATVGTAGIA